MAAAVTTVDADLRDRERTATVVRQARPDWIFHLAAHGAYSWQQDRRAIFDTNFGGTVNLVEAALAVGFEALVHAGSSSEYGFADHPPAETAAPRPNSDYAVGKAAATLFCGHVAHAYDAHVVTLRLYSVYGPWEEPNRLVPTLLVHGLEGRLPPLVDPRVARDLVYAEDVSRAFVRAAEQRRVPRGAVYNVGSGIQTTIHEVVQLARDLLGVDAEPAWGSMPNRSWDTHSWVADATRIRDELGWKPTFDVEAGLRATVAWLRDDPARLELYRRQIGLREAVG